MYKVKRVRFKEKVFLQASSTLPIDWLDVSNKIVKSMIIDGDFIKIIDVKGDINLVPMVNVAYINVLEDKAAVVEDKKK